jgi:hypothetical protein
VKTRFVNPDTLSVDPIALCLKSTWQPDTLGQPTRKMLNQPFFKVPLPIMVTMLATLWALISTNNKHLDDLNKRLDDIVARLGRIEDRLLGLETRFGAVERKVDALELKAWR